MIALAAATSITLAVIAFFALLTVLIFLRLLLRNEAPKWKRLRWGVFVERDTDERGP
jgi:hypothetical protein